MTTITPTRPAQDAGHVDRPDAAPVPTGDAGRTPWTQRTVEAITRRLSTRHMGRRSFLTRAALVGSALAVDPIGFILKPGTAWATVCGEDNEFHEGWSAFCATINDGANTCPSGSFVAGWWKIDNTTFCSGRARYIVDCNRSPGSSCSCHAANGECDRRRVCCNNFRYGQCNTHIRGTTQVVCRIVLCTPPWEWGNCTTTSLTSNATRTHWSSRLPSRTNPTPISVYWLEAGLTGSVVGDIVGSERASPDGGAWARFDRGVLTSTPNGTVRRVLGPHATAHIRRGGGNGVLGRPRQDISASQRRGPFVHGSTYRNGDEAFAVWGPVDNRYRTGDGYSGWMGPPVRDMERNGPYDIVHTASGWKMVWSDTLARSTILRSVDELPGDGSFPAKVRVQRWGGDRYNTAIRVSREAYPDGTSTVILVRGDSHDEVTVAGAVAARLGAAVLFCGPTRMSTSTRTRIQRMRPTQGIVIGDRAAIPSGIARDLRNLCGGNVVRRLSGTDTYGTAADVSQFAFPSGTDTVFLVNANDAPDAISIAPVAHRRRAAVLLSRTNSIPPVTARELRRLGPDRVILVGPRSSVGARVARELRDEYGYEVSRVWGGNNYATSAATSRMLGGTSEDLIVTTAEDFPQGLAASTWANPRRTPILLADDVVSDAVDREIRRRRPTRIIVVGNDKAVSRALATQLGGYVR